VLEYDAEISLDDVRHDFWLALQGWSRLAPAIPCLCSWRVMRGWSSRSRAEGKAP